LHEWVKRHEVDAGLRDGIASEVRERIKALEREVKELRRANEVLKLASAFFCPEGGISFGLRCQRDDQIAQLTRFSL